MEITVPTTHFQSKSTNTLFNLIDKRNGSNYLKPTDNDKKMKKMILYYFVDEIEKRVFFLNVVFIETRLRS